MIILILAKSILDNIETLVSQTLIDMEIRNEQFNMNITEKQKYERMKENVRNVSEHSSAKKQENMRLNDVNSRKITSLQLMCVSLKQNVKGKQSKIIKQLHRQKILLTLFGCVYKMLILAKKTDENNNIEVTVDGIGALWLNEKHIEEKLGHKYLRFITNKYVQYTKSTVMNQQINQKKANKQRVFMQ